VTEVLVSVSEIIITRFETEPEFGRKIGAELDTVAFAPLVDLRFDMMESTLQS